jgi:alcohol dehydrogenase
MKKVLYRTYQKGFSLAAKVTKYREQDIIEGNDSVLRLPAYLQGKGISKALIVTDAGITSIGLLEPLLQKLQEENIQYFIFDKTVPNPTIGNIEEAYFLYRVKRCQAIIAVGGGSSIDCAKGVAARLANPHKSIEKMKGLFKVLHDGPLFVAVPTTSGTGSETTAAAVVSNPATHEKYAIMDTALIPHVAVLDPLLTVGLPKHITAATGMDALTHAVESYVGLACTPEVAQYSKQAVQLIFENLYETYVNGDNMDARDKMQRASFYAGAAFTRALVGNVHAIAHTLSGFYNVPHGLANAVIMPYILDYYGEAVYAPLAELADVAKIVDPALSEEQKAKAFIAAIRDLNESMDIPTTIDGIVDEDIPEMVKRALAEANPLYPVPVIMDAPDMTRIYKLLQGCS